MSATPKIPYCWTEGDLLPDLVLTYVDQDLTGFTITLHLLRKDGSVVVIPATGIDLVQGNFKFSWGVGDLVEGFNQELEIQFINTLGQPMTSARVLIDVRGQIA